MQQTGEDGKEFTQLPGHTLALFIDLGQKRQFMNWRSNPGYATYIDCTEWVEVDDPTAATGKKWDKQTRKKKIKCAPDVKQFERRLTAPLHELMNAWSTAYEKRFKGRAIKAHGRLWCWWTLAQKLGLDNSSTPEPLQVPTPQPPQ